MILYGFCAQQSPGKKNEPNGICIVTDEAITDALDFDNYSQAISNIITNSAKIHSWNIRWMGNRQDHYDADDTKPSPDEEYN
jgi:hypothetical protein